MEDAAIWSFQTTYEELKLLSPGGVSVPKESRFQTTYEELKLKLNNSLEREAPTLPDYL